ncbi:Uncharacterised protein [Bordetella pertussis]|nr:Uncharacterised protein [Bordetella pertussis]CFL94603.1 Uncharacterised protein [Bordetella pertussis]CFM23112.1 Uncharacterised protein [Bordetella pertussis]CFM63954.1 Uncharacterised protein [Bordetella pertussis]CFM75260.1 Uncharacterised protein [Bordetella pertussis]
MYGAGKQPVHAAQLVQFQAVAQYAVQAALQTRGQHDGIVADNVQPYVPEHAYRVARVHALRQQQRDQGQHETGSGAAALPPAPFAAAQDQRQGQGQRNGRRDQGQDLQVAPHQRMHEGGIARPAQHQCGSHDAVASGQRNTQRNRFVADQAYAARRLALHVRLIIGKGQSARQPRRMRNQHSGRRH